MFPLPCSRVGRVKVGDSIEIVGMKPGKEKVQKVQVAGVESYHQQLTEGLAGDNVGVLLKNAKHELLTRGQVLCAPSSLKAIKQF